MPTTSVSHIIRRRRNRKQHKRLYQAKTHSWTAFILVLVLALVIIPLGGVLGVTAWLYARASATLPSAADTLYLDPVIGVTRLYDASGTVELLAVQDPLGEGRAWLKLEDLPAQVIQATLTMEDPSYLERIHFSASDTLSKLWNYVIGLPTASDNSITGRLVRNALLPLARQSSGLDDVLLEIVLSAEVNRRYTPRALLEWHLNTNDYANDAYGIDAAAQVYLGKRAYELTLDEAALLAAIPSAPRFNPFANEAAARGRQADLLRAMLANGRVTQSDYDQAISRYTPLRPETPLAEVIAPEFAAYAREQAQTLLDGIGLDGARLVSRGGLRITTTLDLDLYYQAECALRAQLGQLRGISATGLTALDGDACASALYLEASLTLPSSPPDSGSLVLMDVASGEIRAMVGDARGERYQAGPLLQPFAYLEGFRSGEFTPASMVLDIPQNFAGPVDGLIYAPQNPDGQFRGPMNLRDAFASFLLPPAVAVADARGINRVLSSAHILGINSLQQVDAYDLSLLERGGQVSLLDMSYAYSVFATLGYMQGVDIEPLARGYRARNPVAIRQIEDNTGTVLWAYDAERRALSRTNILGEDFGYLITHLLADNNARRAVLGQDLRPLDLGRPSAVAYGVTSDQRDNWTIGYTPQLLAGVYVGRRDQAPMSLSVWGMEGASSVWNAVLRYAHERDSLAPASWSRPAGIEEYVVCERSGLLPNPQVDCPRRSELFLSQVPPFQTDNFWQVYEVNSQTRQLATAYTPDNLRLRSVFFIPPQTALDWWRSNNLPLPPTDYDTVSRPQVLKAVQLFLPTNFAYVGGQVDVRGAIDQSAQAIKTFQLSYGQGLNPIQWFEIGGARSDYQDGASLGTWDTSGLDGIYTLQLTATFANDSRDSDFVQVTIDNQAPLIRLQAGEAGQVFRYLSDRAIPIVAEVSDNLAIERVEFYHEGKLLGVDREWPYGFEFPISRAGEEAFSAAVFDQVGNSANADLSVTVAR